MFRRTLGDGVLSSDGQLWRWQRRTIAPLFRHSEILTYIPDMAQPAEDQLAKWRGAPAGSIQQIDADMVETTFSVIARTMLIGGEPREAEIIKRATARSLAHISWEIMYGLLGVPLWVPHPALLVAEPQRQADCAARYPTSSRGVRPKAAAATICSGGCSPRAIPKPDAPMTMEQLINNLLTLLEAGHETTSRALSWTLYLLARAPEWQEQVREEVRRRRRAAAKSAPGICPRCASPSRC